MKNNYLFFILISFILLIATIHAHVNAVSPFVTRSGNTLMVNGASFRFSGANMHWLGLDCSSSCVTGDPSAYPPTSDVDTAIADAKTMGLTVIRSHTLGISVGCASCIEPSLNHFNTTAFQSIDYAIKKAKDNNIRLIIPLVDNWHYNAGGKHTFTDWENDTNEDHFFTNPAVIADFKTYISHLLTHQNQYTGIALKDDPTILAWETGNELNTATTQWDDSWTQMIAGYIKSIDPNHLVADGHMANDSPGFLLTASQLQNSTVDMFTDHFYPPNISRMQTNASLAKQYGKVYYVGEYDWTDQTAVSAAATISQDTTTSSDQTASAKITITKNAPNAYYVQLLSNTFSLSGSTTISFWAKASNSNAIQVDLQQAGSPYTVYDKQSFTLNSAWKQYTYSYTPQASLSNVWLAFNLGLNTGTVWIDNVTVGSNKITNGSFESAGTNGMTPWLFQVQSTQSDILATFLPAIQTNQDVTGDLFWDMFGNPNQGDQYKFYYHSTNADTQARALKIAAHATIMGSYIPIMTQQAAATTTSPVGIAGTWNMIFNDEFNGTTLDTTKWNTLRGSTATYAGYGDPFNPSSEDAYYTPNNVSVSSGNLVLTMKQGTTNGYPYSSGLVTSDRHFDFTYGYMEARIKVPTGLTGSWPAFWAVNATTWPPEIDDFEFSMNNTSTRPSFNYHWGTGSSPQQSGPTLYGTAGTDYTQDWHTYGMSWDQNKIQVYLDGVPGPSYTTSANITNLPLFILLNLSVHKGATVPNNTQMLVDYVRVWQPTTASPTPTSVTVSSSPNPTATPNPTSILPNIPTWFSQMPMNLQNFLEQLYVTVYYFQRTSNMEYLLDGVFPTPTP